MARSDTPPPMPEDPAAHPLALLLGAGFALVGLETVAIPRRRRGLTR